MLNKFIGIIFPTAFAHFMSLCHIFVILTIFQTFSLLYLLWWSVITDLWCHYCTVLGCYKSHPCKTKNLTIKCCVCFDCSTDQPFPHFSPSSWASIFWDTTISKIGQLIILQWPICVQVIELIDATNFIILKNCYGYPTFCNHHRDQLAVINIKARLCQQKYYNLLKA